MRTLVEESVGGASSWTSPPTKKTEAYFYLRTQRPGLCLVEVQDGGRRQEEQKHLMLSLCYDCAGQRMIMVRS